MVFIFCYLSRIICKNCLRFLRGYFSIEKAVLVGDITNCLKLQRILLSSNSARLIAIKYATNIFLKNNSFETNSKFSITFLEKLKLNKYLFLNTFNWKPQKLKKFYFLKENGMTQEQNVFSIEDQTWHILVKLSLEPSYEPIFSPLNFGFRSKISVHDAQKFLFLNLGKNSYGFQKRVLILNFSFLKYSINYNVLLRKIILPKSIKVSLFKFFNSGFLVNFDNNNTLSSLLANILLHGIEEEVNCMRFGSQILIFLFPIDNEVFIFNKLHYFLGSIGFHFNISDLSVCSLKEGFDFLGWHFKCTSSGDLFCSPSLVNYRIFLKRVKNIINNSNYGAVRFI